VGPTVGPLSVSDRSKRYLVLLKVPRKLLTLRSLQTCQGSGVGSIPIGRSILFKRLRSSFSFHSFQNINLIAKRLGKCGRYVLERYISAVQPGHCFG
jgi:hypothetical protein